jgi:uncharacterized protein YndB with AHSA1/START domain
VLSNGVSVERVVRAPAEQIFAILADPSRHREIDGSGTVRDAVDAPTRVELGSRFGMDMKAGGAYRMVNEVVEFEPDRRIAWQARPDSALFARGIGGRIWRYELEPQPESEGGGTLVRETWDISQEKVPALVWGLRALTRISMNRTLDRIEKLVG